MVAALITIQDHNIYMYMATKTMKTTTTTKHLLFKGLCQFVKSSQLHLATKK